MEPSTWALSPSSDWFFLHPACILQFGMDSPQGPDKKTPIDRENEKSRSAMPKPAQVPAGFSMMIQMASSNTLIQSMVPDRLRGRVMSVYAMTFMGMAPLGALLAGSLAHNIGAPWTVAMGGLVSIAGAVLFGVRLPVHRPVAREMIVAQQMAGGAPAQEMTGRVFEKAG
jgi:MFS transporter